jgi:hypothetical protein
MFGRLNSRDSMHLAISSAKIELRTKKSFLNRVAVAVAVKVACRRSAEQAGATGGEDDAFRCKGTGA